MFAVAALAALTAPSAALAQVPGETPPPIPQGPLTNVPAFTGSAAKLDPTPGQDVPRHPFMAPNGRSNIHDDAYQSDTYTGLGPLATGNRSTSDQDRPDFAKNGPISRYRVRRMGIQAIPMSERNVSDLVFRDLDSDTPPSRAFDDAWEASLREELEKLRPVRPAPRVIPAADATDRPPRRGR